MADLTVKQQVLEKTDYFLVQRPSKSGTGLSSTPNFKVSAEDIGIFSSNYIHDDFEAVKLEFKDIQNQLGMIMNDIIPTIKMTLTDHDIRIMVLEDETQKQELDIININTRIDNALSKTRLFLYHRLVDSDVANTDGEMVVFGENDSTVTSLEDVKKIEYTLEATQNISNVFVGETLELTCQSGVSGEGAAFSHRAIYKIDYIQSLGGNRVYFEVTARNVSGNGIPFYELGLDNLVRTDFYPIFTISKNEYDEGLDLTYKKRGGTITGNVKIEKTGSGLLELHGENANKIDFLEELRLTREGSEILRLEQSRVFCKVQFDVNGNQIKGVAGPTDDTDVATKSYVDRLISQNDITADDLYKPGEAVVANNAAKAETYGFFYQSGSLYFKAP